MLVSDQGLLNTFWILIRCQTKLKFETLVSAKDKVTHCLRTLKQCTAKQQTTNETKQRTFLQSIRWYCILLFRTMWVLSYGHEIKASGSPTAKYAILLNADACCTYQYTVNKMARQYRVPIGAFLWIKDTKFVSGINLLTQLYCKADLSVTRNCKQCTDREGGDRGEGDMSDAVISQSPVL